MNNSGYLRTGDMRLSWPMLILCEAMNVPLYALGIHKQLISLHIRLSTPVVVVASAIVILIGFLFIWWASKLTLLPLLHRRSVVLHQHRGDDRDNARVAAEHEDWRLAKASAPRHDEEVVEDILLTDSVKDFHRARSESMKKQQGGERNRK